ncbi:type II toxin-antitoxin system PemK/MazF family toxin [uncultured Methylobacterium sp.]|uniref:type II toxin-antitoxin system PemK/MazF family toxin n=1 Tax=uncultured Methylobacterium sp. TaxID=157278 RepID=UPI00261EC210|nr:type II toxin-antitoxin system PemK/MazF family toxin [uncultured Methylobacterium sp.]
MPITFVPQRGQILICDFDMARVPPEMRKVRRVVVVSPRSYNARHGQGPGRCLVVPFSASMPPVVRPSDVPFAAGVYRSLTVPTWAICSSVAALSHARLDRVAAGRSHLSESLSPQDLARVEDGLRHALGL